MSRGRHSDMGMSMTSNAPRAQTKRDMNKKLLNIMIICIVMAKLWVKERGRKKKLKKNEQEMKES